jgi:hypothetical protein
MTKQRQAKPPRHRLSEAPTVPFRGFSSFSFFLLFAVDRDSWLICLPDLRRDRINIPIGFLSISAAMRCEIFIRFPEKRTGGGWMDGWIH